MLSYQHIYHAGCLADVHKHAILSILLTRVVLSDDHPMAYFETHSGRGLYDLNSPESKKTGEAAKGIQAVLNTKFFHRKHPFQNVLRQTHRKYGQNFYPGSPLIAKFILRPQDQLYLMEMHPQEGLALKKNLRGLNVQILQGNGYQEIFQWVPIRQRRGLILIDPSYEIKSEYDEMASFVLKLHRQWPDAILMLWYPMLKARLYKVMLDNLDTLNLPLTFHHGVQFGDPLVNRGLFGSGLYFVNYPGHLMGQDDLHLPFQTVV